MSKYPAALSRDHRLFDGRSVTIRPVLPSDAQPMRDFLAGLSDENRYLRFQKWLNTPPENLIHFLTNIDYDKHLAFVCAVRSGGGEQLVGEVRYVIDRDERNCEFSIVIADSWQKTGIAGLLMDALIRAARERGLRVMEGIVLSSNSTMLHFTRALGFEISAVPEDRTVTRIVKRL